MMRLGFNIHAKIMGQEYSAAQKTYLATLLTRLNPSAILVMNNWDWALAYKHLVPKSIVVFRQYNKDVEGALWDNQSAKEYFVNTTNRHDPNIVLYIGNESQSYILKTEMQKAVAWWVQIIGLFRDANLPICLPNWGVGHPDLTWFTQDDKWAIMKPLIDAFKTHPSAYLGLHEYFSYLGVEIGNGRVGRHADIAKALKARGYDMPPVLLTELGCDQIDDTGKRGFKHSMSDNAYAAMLTECQRSTWNVDYIKGGMIYCFGSVTDEWSSFDVSDSLVLHGALVAANMSVGNPPPIEPTPPPPPPLDAIVPSDLGNALAVRVTGDNWYLRAEPRVSAAQIGKLMAGEEIKLYPSTATLADDQSYKVIKRIITVAGEASTAWTAYPTPANAPSLPSDDNLNTIARLIVIRAKIHAMASLMEDVVKDILQMELDIAAAEAAKAADIANAA